MNISPVNPSSIASSPLGETRSALQSCQPIVRTGTEAPSRGKRSWRFTVMSWVFFGATLPVHCDTAFTFVNQGNCTITITYNTHLKWLTGNEFHDASNHYGLTKTLTNGESFTLN